jgi:hypothetical protein
MTKQYAMRDSAVIFGSFIYHTKLILLAQHTKQTSHKIATDKRNFTKEIQAQQFSVEYPSRGVIRQHILIFIYLKLLYCLTLLAIPIY